MSGELRFQAWFPRRCRHSSGFRASGIRVSCLSLCTVQGSGASEAVRNLRASPAKTQSLASTILNTKLGPAHRTCKLAPAKSQR